MQQRDVFINELRQLARHDKKIVFLSADFGSPELDHFREEHPDKFIHCGISEQNMINVAVGLALSGKHPFIYAMSPFFIRCFEQLKLAAFHDVPLTVLSVGAGLSYAGSGPTHYATEDVALFRQLANTEVYTFSTNNMAAYFANQPPEGKMRIFRMERGELPELYDKLTLFEDGMIGDGVATYGYMIGDGVATYGYMVHWLRKRGYSVLDVYRNHPLPISQLDYEEQYPNGTATYSLPHRAIYENGTRDELLESFFGHTF